MLCVSKGVCVYVCACVRVWVREREHVPMTPRPIHRVLHGDTLAKHTNTLSSSFSLSRYVCVCLCVCVCVWERAHIPMSPRPIHRVLHGDKLTKHTNKLRHLQLAVAVYVVLPEQLTDALPRHLPLQICKTFLQHFQSHGVEVAGDCLEGLCEDVRIAARIRVCCRRRVCRVTRSDVFYCIVRSVY